MVVQLVCPNGTELDYPQQLVRYSELIHTMVSEPGAEESDAEGSDDEEEATINIPVNVRHEVCNLMLEILKMNFKKDYINIAPVPKKVTAPKFNIVAEIGEETNAYLEEAGKDAVFAIAKLADYLGIRLVCHICFTFIANKLNTLTIENKMKWLGLSGEPPTFEEIMAVNLNPNVGPKLPPVDVGGGATK